MSTEQKFGAGIWHFATYVDRYATDGYGEPRSILDAIDLAGQVRDLSVVDLNWPFFGGDFSNEQVKEALTRNNLDVVGITPEIYTRVFAKGAFTNPDPGVRKLAHELVTKAADVVRYFGADYVKLWPGQDGWDYPFQVDYGTLWKHSMDGVGQLASENPDLKFVIEYKPREPRVHMSYPRSPGPCSASRRSACPTSASCSISATPCSAANRPPTQRSWPSTTAACSAWTSTTTAALGRRPGRRQPAPHRTVRVLLRPAKRTTGKASGSSTNSPSAKTASRPRTAPSTSSRPSSAAWPSSTSRRSRSAQSRHDAVTALRMAQQALFTSY